MHRTVTVVLLATICAGCGELSGSSGRPGAIEPSRPGAVEAPGTAARRGLRPDSHGLTLTPIAGAGHGIVNVSSTAGQIGLSVETQVAVWQTRPGTTFDVKRAVDVTADGVCSSTNFVQLPLPNPGPLVKLTTSPGGAGTVHAKFALPQLADGTVLAVRFQVSSEDSSIVLQTECFTLLVK